MNPFWHLTWLIPLTVLLGFGLSTFFPGLGHGRKTDPAPPYVGFDIDVPAVTESINEQVRKDRRKLRMRLFGEERHGRTFGPNAAIPDDFGEE